MSIKKRNFKHQLGLFHNNRAQFIVAVFGFCFVLIVIRTLILQLVPFSSKHLDQIADRQYNKQLVLYPYRGKVFDRRGEALAISIKTSSFFVNPRVFSPSHHEVRQLAKIFNLKEQYIIDLTKKKSYFAWLKRKVPDQSRDNARSLTIEGMHEIVESARFYPTNQTLAPVLGFVGIDNNGLMAIERQYNDILQGTAFRISPSQDALGRTIFLDSMLAVPEKPGRSLQLTIDKVIQEITQDELIKGIKQANAKAGFAIVSDPHTGKILALANYPSFNPNDTDRLNLEHTKNRALMDSIEPGSVMKTFVIAAALERNLITPHDKFDCENGVYHTDRIHFQDSHPPPQQYLSVTDTLVHSSNVCTFKIAQKLGSEALYNGYLRFGFGTQTAQLNFPGQAFGTLSHWQSWRPIRFANLAFGQGLMSNGIEIVQAYSVIANGGNLMKPLYIDKVIGEDGKLETSFSTEIIHRVISPETARKMRLMLGEAVNKKTNLAETFSYTAGGKTGTSQKIDPITKAYSHTKHLASFAGITPINDPHLVIYVAIDEPQMKVHYGALWAAPVFSKIAERTLKYLNVAPDKDEKIQAANKTANEPKQTRI